LWVSVPTAPASLLKSASLIAAEQQLCYAHGTQRAVFDVLYRQQRAAESLTRGPNSEDNSDINLTDDEQENEDLDVTDSYYYDVPAELSHGYLEVINKVHTIIK
jgi:hypothetical protein